MTHDHPPIYNEHTPPYCGECPLLLHEDTDGYGVCNAAGQTRNCGQVCIYANRYPHAWEVTRILHYTQKWRRGANIKMPHHIKITDVMAERLQCNLKNKIL